jgi:hypothetical protein
MTQRFYAKDGSRVHRLYISESVSRMVWNASIHARLQKGYELIEEETTSNRAVFRNPDPKIERKYVMRLWQQEE